MRLQSAAVWRYLLRFQPEVGQVAQTKHPPPRPPSTLDPRRRDGHGLPGGRVQDHGHRSLTGAQTAAAERKKRMDAGCQWWCRVRGWKGVVRVD
eukprot:926855-Rhodomonas_salina.2